MIYEELRALAQRYLFQERAGHTLQATALVNEAYLHLRDADRLVWTDRAHFFRIAARTMRHILINHAERRGAAKRGGGRKPVELAENIPLRDGEPDENLLDLDEALKKLAREYPQKAEVVELRHFGGCTIDEAAEALGVSTATVERDWRFARAWLLAELSGGDEPRADP